MFHIRKGLSAKEQREYREWLEKHKAGIPKVSKAVRAERAETFWEKHAKQEALIKSLRAGGDTSNIPSGPSREPISFEVRRLLDPESQEMLAREKIAQQEAAWKRANTAPAYNKGPYVYYTDEMLRDFPQSRRR